MVKLDSLIAVIVTLSTVRASAGHTHTHTRACVGNWPLITIKRPFGAVAVAAGGATALSIDPIGRTRTRARSSIDGPPQPPPFFCLCVCMCARAAAGWPAHDMLAHARARHKMRMFVVTYARAAHFSNRGRSVSLYGRSPRAISSEDNNSI